MQKSVEARIRAVYPNGNDWEPDKSQLEVEDYAGAIRHVLAECVQALPLSVTTESSSLQYHNFAFTRTDGPEFGTWIWAMSNAEKIRWIQENNSPYVVLFFQVSRIADFYISHFNYWHPRGDTGYLDIDFESEPSDEWRGYFETISGFLNEDGFLLASPEMLNESVPFVLTWGGDAIPENDPRWDDDNFEPDPVPSTVYDCLFAC